MDTIQPAIRGLGVLANLETFSDKSAIETMESFVQLVYFGEYCVHFCCRVFAHVQMKSFPQNVRFTVFKLVDLLMNRHRTGMRILVAI